MPSTALATTVPDLPSSAFDGWWLATVTLATNMNGFQVTLYGHADNGSDLARTRAAEFLVDQATRLKRELPKHSPSS